MEILVTIAGAAGLVWAAILLRRGGLLAGSLVVMLAGTCFSVPFFKLPGPVPLTIDRLLFVGLCVQFLFWRRQGLADPKPLGTPEWVLLALVGYVTLRTFTADWQANSYQGLSWLILYYLMPLGMYWIGRQSQVTPGTLRALWAALAVFGVYLAVTTLAEFFQCWALVFPPYIRETAQAGEEWVGRGRGPVLTPIGNGVMLAVCLGATLLWWPRLKSSGRVAVAAAMGLLAAALYSSLTRSVWIGGLAAPAIIIGLALPRRLRLPVFAGGLIVAVIVTALSWQTLMNYKRERHLDAKMAAESAQLRPVLAKIAWDMFCDRPVFGCGFSQYGREHKNYLADRTTDLPLEKGRGYIPHNIVFSLLTETGAIGLALYLAVLGLWVRDGWRLWHDPSLPLEFRQQGLLLLVGIAAFAINGMFHDLTVVPMGHMTLFFLAGWTAAVRPAVAAATARAVAPVPPPRPCDAWCPGAGGRAAAG